MAATDPQLRPIDLPTLEAMTSAIEHRGPDEAGHEIQPGVALGMRRLSIIDVAGSHQPVETEDGDVIAVFNGEIFNFPELRSELGAKGHRLVTRGDGETIVHLYEEHGLDFVRRLRGMFAIALWDKARRRLVLARDRMGVKPLYYADTGHGLAFASEVKSLIAGGLVRPELDPLGAELFLAHGFVPGPYTLFAGVRKLPPASTMVFENGELTEPRPYWHPFEAGPPRPPAPWEEEQERLLELLRESVRARMISDVPLGVMLSGGLDSSLITALMAEQSSRPLQTFSIGFVEDAVTELDDAEQVSRRFGTEHHALLTSAAEHRDLLDQAIWHLEGPIADVSCLGFILLSRLAREHVTVALSGQGADELLGGYRKHEIAAAAAAMRRWVPDPTRRLVAAAARRPVRRSPLARGMLALATDDPAERLLAMSRVLQPNERAELLHPDFQHPGAETEIAGVVDAHVPPVAMSPLGETLHIDSRLALVDNMLLYFDKMSMAASLEVRVPFLDHDVVSFCSRLPDSRRVWRMRRKELLKRASRGLVDDRIIDKPKKGFFHEGLGAWLTYHRETLVRESLLEGPALDRGIYRREAVLELVERAQLDDKKASQRLFSLLALERWMLMFVDGQAVPVPGRRRASARRADLAYRDGEDESSDSRPERAAPTGPTRLEPCRALTRAGYDVTVICPQGSSRHSEPYERLEGVDIHRYRARYAEGGIATYAIEYVSALWSMGRLARRLASKRPFDLVHACSPPDFLLLCVLPLRRRGTRFIFDHHDLTPELFASRFGRSGGLVHRATLLAEQVPFRLADVVLSVNDSYRNVALTRGRRRPEEVHVVRTGPDLDRFVPTAGDPSLKNGKPYLLSYVGVMGPQDGVDHAIRALAVLRGRRQDWHAVFMGDGEMLDAMRELALELDLKDAIEFTGWVDHNTVSRVLSTSDVCLAPDPKNPLNDISSMIKISEYMAMSRPIVSYDLHESRVSAADAAAYALANDVADFAEQIDELLDNPARRHAMGVAGRARVESMLAWEHQERSLLSAYARALSATA